ncbi:hypothetical protein NEUTE1DRAFT_111686 [Neurospora tetrasperma FGSC 2508]|uniref:Uncharacterized protein n=1 Tax=Neurospora tetrasperma (strain FGSC 2508 / ATCC MYA-4615 / P0657) TaxID=510951 RepID=F8MST9_NEUT8|nr:uncharacterized protein NEUTE1DRAFT_111686 [Neurospora tetrasperma FGSC 2508]EGO55122.1 hypothetical protein NEUTE1DRAFT_111686 [Neurospora tetrasperma FGSC 2508]EGZ69665.1 hypothetical protein NEUTE2DRAFT_169260 [Neurospora tetrasperma FGSC 2509]
MANRGVKRNFDTVDPSSDTTTDNNMRMMREPNPSPTTAPASEPRFYPTTNDPTTGGDMSRAARPSANQGIPTITSPAQHDPTPSDQATPNANTGVPDANATTPRAAYHRRQAAATVQRIVLEESVALTEQIAETLTERELRQILRTCIIRQASGIPQRAMIKYLIRKLALMKMVNHPDFPEWFERFQRGEMDVESGAEADDEMEEGDEYMGEAEEVWDTDEGEAREDMAEAGEKMDAEEGEAGENMGEAGEMDTEETEEAGEEMDTES